MNDSDLRVAILREIVTMPGSWTRTRLAVHLGQDLNAVMDAIRGLQSTGHLEGGADLVATDIGIARCPGAAPGRRDAALVNGARKAAPTMPPSVPEPPSASEPPEGLPKEVPPAIFERVSFVAGHHGGTHRPSSQREHAELLWLVMCEPGILGSMLSERLGLDPGRVNTIRRTLAGRGMLVRARKGGSTRWYASMDDVPTKMRPYLAPNMAPRNPTRKPTPKRSRAPAPKAPSLIPPGFKAAVGGASPELLESWLDSACARLAEVEAECAAEERKVRDATAALAILRLEQQSARALFEALSRAVEHPSGKA